MRLWSNLRCCGEYRAYDVTVHVFILDPVMALWTYADLSLNAPDGEL